MRSRFYGLKRGKLRQSWNKYNLYNLSRAVSPINTTQTYFQQKWYAKAATRAYHGETILEKHWQRLFSPIMRSVTPMDPKYLANNDGSELAAGRGSGMDLPPNQRRGSRPVVPYMNMVYAPAERRLDTAVFRALFASSTRQARQFVVRGDVKVNGKKMIYPGYLLNPGDMFQVDPERVMYATGAPKTARERRATRRFRRKQKDAADPDSEPAKKRPPRPASAESAPSLDDSKATLRSLLDQAKSILGAEKTTASAKRKQDLRAFQRLLRRTLSLKTHPTALTDSLDAQLLELTARLNISDLPAEPAPADAPVQPPTTQTISSDQRRALRLALAEARENPIDPSKPYATPWRPRDWMSPFAFVPRYLEVHHKICSAVYLRHPVARPGLGEVPTPFGNEMNGLAFNWYLRRR